MIEKIKGDEIPVKVIVGEHDLELKSEFMHDTYKRWLPNSEITMLANCGHYLMLETPLSLAAEC